MAFDWQTDEVRIHVDGCPDTVSDLSGCDGFTGSDKFFLGASSALEQPFNLRGQLDEVQLYNPALSAGDVRSIFEAGGSPAACADAQVPALGAAWSLLLVTALAVLGAVWASFRRRSSNPAMPA